MQIETTMKLYYITYFFLMAKLKRGKPQILVMMGRKDHSTLLVVM
jgi:hypothetical protein